MSVEAELLESCKVYAQQIAAIDRIEHKARTMRLSHQQQANLIILRRKHAHRERLLLELCASIGQSLAPDGGSSDQKDQNP